MSKTNFEITNYKEINDMLDEMGSQFKQQAWRSVNTKILNTIVKPKLKENLTIDKPEINDDISVDTVRDDKSAAVIGYKSKNGGWMVKFFEYGTPQRFTKRFNKKRNELNRGTLNPKPFVERTYEESIKDCIEMFNKEGEELIGKYLERKSKTITNKIKKLGI
jgi:HK97 gp10 family phage protein